MLYNVVATYMCIVYTMKLAISLHKYVTYHACNVTAWMAERRAKVPPSFCCFFCHYIIAIYLFLMLADHCSSSKCCDIKNKITIQLHAASNASKHDIINCKSPSLVLPDHFFPFI